MENKKPLIIVPPMSEPLKKLYEVLDGIAAEENIEIYIVEDAKEFTQLVGSGGQSLVMMSNAKMCATLLQDNKSVIARNHSKVILMTPKEIPQKTLVKFTKIGLTEAILENSPPKTLLYKVKLLLRSIKVTNKEEAAPQVIKSMLDLNQNLKTNEELKSENNHIEEISHAEENESEKTKKFSKDEDSSLDYLSDLKGKKTAAEDVIETHWKTKKDRSLNLAEDFSEGSLKTKSDNENEIDNYYRGKSKKNNIELSIEDSDDLYKKNKLAEDEEGIDYKKMKEQAFEEIQELERKKRITINEESEDYLDPKSKKEELEESEKKEKKKTSHQEIADLDLDELTNKLINEIEEENRERDLEKKEDLGGYLKGKISKQIELEEETLEESNEINDALDLSSDKERKSHELTDEENKDKNETNEMTSVNEENSPHEGKVDQIDNFMRGDLDSTDAIKTRMESDFFDKDKNNLEETDEDQRKTRNSEYELDDEEQSSNNIHDQNEIDSFEKGDLNLKIESEDEKEYGKNQNQTSLQFDEDEKNENLDAVKEDIELDLEKDKNPMMKMAEEDLNGKLTKSKDEAEDLNRKKLNTTGLNLDDGPNTNTHEGKTDKISTYYKSGESKDRDHDWNITSKNKDINLSLVNSKKDDISIDALKKNKDAGETTIDYRKLKAEFDMIARGEINGGENNSISGSKNTENEIEESSFKVIELGPISFDFSIDILNTIYLPDSKPSQILKMIAEKIEREEKGFIIAKFYSVKDNKYTEQYNSTTDSETKMDDETKSDLKSIFDNSENTNLFHSFSMPTWLCRDIPDNNSYWRDIELPTWASNELTNKKVELLYPLFDGVTRAGYIHVFFPKGINPLNERKIQMILEMSRCVFLDNGKQNISTSTNNEQTELDNKEETKGKIINFFGSMFGKKKAS